MKKEILQLTIHRIETGNLVLILAGLTRLQQKVCTFSNGELSVVINTQAMEDFREKLQC